MICNICNSANTFTIYKSLNGSLSSVCNFNKNNINVFLCKNCLHVYTKFEIDASAYYDKDYNILINSEEEDQLYKILDNGEKIFRTEHQLNLLISKLNINEKSKILDFGCAKSSTMKALSKKIAIKPYLFDISENYKKYWNFTLKENCATYKTPINWLKKFSIITSFFSLEHIKNPLDAIKNINSLLEDEHGKFFFIVPNTLNNIADIVVNEHFNHFTAASIKYMLENNNFIVEEIDTISYDGAFVVIAKKGNVAFKKEHNEKLIRDIEDLGKYWQNIANKINFIESNIKEEQFAIYGSGFYGSFIFSQLKNTDNLNCFIDANPFRCKYKLFKKNIIPPNKLPKNIKNVIVGLNPTYAEKEINKSNIFSNNINFYYL